MGIMLLLLGFLSVFINPLQGDESFQYYGTGDNGENEYHTVTVNEQVKVAVVNVYSGRQSANAIFDYSQNIVAYHMPYKGICVLAHMDIATFPHLGFINEWIHTKREQKKELEELRKHYFVTNQMVYDLGHFGNAVRSLCWGVPTYWAREYPRPQRNFGASACAGIHFFFIRIGLCGGFSL
ncbi:gastrokine-2-like [Hyla sarda]|uniref:gastrokine-2-like n=1 Tax=Hyla sarda TaxID=327740 RepID=UPI0024C32F0F|nr:gastrokine-2-like [Hyla sarda]XP_056427386.1 gastrokine-2-like [Hyla sarda]